MEFYSLIIVLFLITAVIAIAFTLNRNSESEPSQNKLENKKYSSLQFVKFLYSFCGFMIIASTIVFCFFYVKYSENFISKAIFKSIESSPFGNGNIEMFNYSYFYGSLFGGVFSGTFCIGFSQLIQLLFDIKSTLKK